MPLKIQNPDRLPSKFAIFYCWQDALDAPLHRWLIKEALTNAINKVQLELSETNCELTLVTGPEGRSGSVGVADTILENISSSSFFIADVTPVTVAESGHFCPNPNVMFELGYGASALGWNKIGCVFNKARINDEDLKPEQLPFDIRHRTFLIYKCSAESGRAQAIKELEAQLVAQIRLAIKKIDERRFDPGLPDQALRRERDLRLLRELLISINRNAIDRYITEANEGSLYDDCDYFWYGFHGVVRSSRFKLYDKELEKLIREFHAAWNEIGNIFGLIYHSAPGGKGFTLKERHLWSSEYEKMVNRKNQLIPELHKKFQAFLIYVHEHYPEIDLDETDQIAREDNLPYMTGEIFDNNPDDSVDNSASDSS